MREQVIERIEKEKLIAIVRGVSADQCSKVANALYAGGVRLMEITYNPRIMAADRRSDRCTDRGVRR